MIGSVVQPFGFTTSSAVSALGGAAGEYFKNKQAKAATAKQMQFQADMSNTAYQRAMADMRKAGLNPILAGKVGGASTPGGATYNPTNISAAGSEAALRASQRGLQDVQTYATRQQGIKTQTEEEKIALDAKLSEMDVKAFQEMSDALGITLSPKTLNTIAGGSIATAKFLLDALKELGNEKKGEKRGKGRIAIGKRR